MGLLLWKTEITMRSMTSALLLIAIGGSGAGCTAYCGPGPADAFVTGGPTPPQILATSPAPPGPVTSTDTIVLLASDSVLGPDSVDTAIAARYYCSQRGKLAAFVSKNSPPEMRDRIMPSYSLMTFRCVQPAVPQ
jgi:hypothetical protein